MLVDQYITMADRMAEKYGHLARKICDSQLWPQITALDDHLVERRKVNEQPLTFAFELGRLEKLITRAALEGEQ
jgi:hypothetical protein